MNFTDFLNHFVTLLVIANPLSAIPAVLRVTRNDSPAERKNTVFVATLAVGIIFLVVTWFGKQLLAVLGIRIPAFQIAGGIVLMLLALSMLHAEESAMKQNPDEKRETGAIVPLAMPIIAGPGAISSLIVSVNDHPGVANLLVITSSALLVTIVMGLVLWFSTGIERAIGRKGISIFNRIGGLILASIAVQSFANGCLGFFPGWGAAP